MTEIYIVDTRLHTVVSICYSTGPMEPLVCPIEPLEDEPPLDIDPPSFPIAESTLMRQTGLIPCPSQLEYG